MPPEPAHIRSWRGAPVLLEVQREGAARVRIASHENEYIGLLRQRLAGYMACNAKNVRMFSMGELCFSPAFDLPFLWAVFLLKVQGMLPPLRVGAYRPSSRSFHVPAVLAGGC